MSDPKRPRRRPIQRTLMLDLLADKKARPILLYAATTVLVGATIYHWLEGWGWLDSVYFTVITIATIGYGDFAPTHPASKVFTIFFVLNGVTVLLMLYDQIRRIRTAAYQSRQAEDALHETALAESGDVGAGGSAPE